MRLPAFLLSLLPWFAALPAHAIHLHLTTESAPPSSILKDGVVVGHATEKIRTMMARAKVTVDIDMLPWQRAYQLALRRPDTCVYDTTRTPEREASFHWIGPIAVTDWILYGLAARKLHLNTLDQARPYKIGTYLSDATEQYLLNQGFKVESVANDALNPVKLITQRIDLWAATPIRATMLMERAGKGAQIIPVLTFNHVQLYLACNKAVPSALIEQLSRILQEMQRDGTSRAIEDKYARWPQP